MFSPFRNTCQILKLRIFLFSDGCLDSGSGIHRELESRGDALAFPIASGTHERACFFKEEVQLPPQHPANYSSLALGNGVVIGMTLRRVLGQETPDTQSIHMHP